jgi:tetratricopeptide (TPR) repeat protein
LSLFNTLAEASGDFLPTVSPAKQCLQVFSHQSADGDRAADIMYFQATISIEGPAMWSLNGLYKSYFAEKSYEEALDVASRMVKLFPDSSIALSNKAEALAAIGHE